MFSVSVLRKLITDEILQNTYICIYNILNTYTDTNSSKDVCMDIKLEEKPGIIVEYYVEGGVGDENCVLYFKNNVMVFWSCVSGSTGKKVKDYEEIKDDSKTIAVM